MPGKSHNLALHFDRMTDEEIIEELSGSPSLRRYAKSRLGIGRDTVSEGYHGAILYYLRNNRPQILARLERTAEELTAAWPLNHDRLRIFQLPGWWYTALKKHFREALRIRMRISGTGTKEDPWTNQPAKAWVDTIWPVIQTILAAEDRLPPSMEDIERVTYQILHLPTRIYLGEYHDPRLIKKGRRSDFVGIKCLNTQIRSLLRKLARAEREKAREALEAVQKDLQKQDPAPKRGRPKKPLPLHIEQALRPKREAG